MLAPASPAPAPAPSADTVAVGEGEAIAAGAVLEFRMPELDAETWAPGLSDVKRATVVGAAGDALTLSPVDGGDAVEMRRGELRELRRVVTPEAAPPRAATPPPAAAAAPAAAATPAPAFKKKNRGKKRRHARAKDADDAAPTRATPFSSTLGGFSIAKKGDLQAKKDRLLEAMA